MRHIISVLLQNEAGALVRVAGLFSSRGYNIESLCVAPTEDERVSRMTLVTSGSDEVISQISKQLAKVVDVVDLVDMSRGDYIERELLFLKLKVDPAVREQVQACAERFNATVLDERADSYTLQLVATGLQVDDCLQALADTATVVEVVRSGVAAIGQGQRNMTYAEPAAQ